MPKIMLYAILQSAQDPPSPQTSSEFGLCDEAESTQSEPTWIIPETLLVLPELTLPSVFLYPGSTIISAPTIYKPRLSVTVLRGLPERGALRR